MFRIQIERALGFWRDGHVTLDSVEQGDKSSIILKSINPFTGKETKATEFNQAKWGGATNAYLDSIRTNIKGKKFLWADFMKAASKFKKPSRHGELTRTFASSSTSAGPKDVRALIVDDPNDSNDSDGSDDHDPESGKGSNDPNEQQ